MRYAHLKNLQKKGQKEIAILIDPDELGDRTPAIIEEALSNHINLFLVGGIKTPEHIQSIWENGADVAVVGNGIFDNPQLINELSQMRHQHYPSLIH